MPFCFSSLCEAYFAGFGRGPLAGYDTLVPMTLLSHSFPWFAKTGVAVLGQFADIAVRGPPRCAPGAACSMGIPPLLLYRRTPLGRIYHLTRPEDAAETGVYPYWFAACSNSARKGANSSSSAFFRARTASSNSL